MWARMRGRPDPRVKLDHEAKARSSGKEFWALRGVSFGVNEGEVVGIVGRNGAGKSTLLKLLSRITVPTQGTISLKGRISSLLEVGTGFHPELTGRENIFLNGTILGMRTQEVARKLDEIIAFSGIEHHIDTPVKRYSSGMKVRLGFAVAAHLEPEILIVDEVLAVGDAEFQRKCMGKMKDVAGSGRTVLFVSHNMVAVRALCSRVIWLDDGQVRQDGPVQEVVDNYLGTYAENANAAVWDDPTHAPGDAHARLRSVRVRPTSGKDVFLWEDGIEVEVDLENLTVDDGDLTVTLHVLSGDEQIVLSTGLRENRPDVQLSRGRNVVTCRFPAQFFNAGAFLVNVLVVRHGRLLFRADQAVRFEVQEPPRTTGWLGRRPGTIRMTIPWEHQDHG
jgi:lipopolysaccharide transport system ATP-binding protein